MAGRPVIWTAQRDQQIRDMRADRESWDAIAVALGLSRWSVMARAAAIKVQTKPDKPLPPAPAGRSQRPPLPPGDPLAMQVLAEVPARWRAIVGL